MRIKRIVLYAAVACAMLAIGCGQTHSDRQRKEARDRWSTSRAEMATRLAEGCYQRGEYGRARQQIEEVLRNGGAPYAPLYLLAARLASEKGELDNARAFAENARAIDPKSAEACYVLGTIEQTLAHADRALAEYAEAAKLDPRQPRYGLAQAEMLVIAGRTDDAAKALTEAADAMPGQAEVQAALGDVLALQRRYGEAVARYRTALHLEPQRADTKEHLARALYYSGAYAEAEPMLAELAGASPDFASGWMLSMRADCLLALGRVPEARYLYQYETKARQGAAAPLVGLAKCDILQNHLTEARQALESALAREPKQAEANALVGYVLVALDRPDEAAGHLERALADPQCPSRAIVERLLARAQSGSAAAAGPATPSGPAVNPS